MKGIASPLPLSLRSSLPFWQEVYAKILTFYVDGETPSLNIRIKFRASTEMGKFSDLEEFLEVSTTGHESSEQLSCFYLSTGRPDWMSLF